jgi:hypothetical protein
MDIDPIAQQQREQAVEETRKAAEASGVSAVDALDGVAEVAGNLIDADVVSSAAEVGGEVVSGAMEALGSGLEVAGGCAEGCSVMIAVVILLATAGTALAMGWY